jgi:peptidoglycan/LPS O-acetylase OafA/YrhL
LPPTKQLLPLTGFRFFLAIWVVSYHQTWPDHYLGPVMQKLPDALFCLLRTGYVAVGFFFVLSGFVLSYAHSLTQPLSSKQLFQFGVSRFARIYPTYCLGLLLIAHFALRSWSPVTPLSNISNTILNWTLLQSWIPHAALTWNAPGWSLSDEAFFYCCFPFIGVALWRISGLRRQWVAASIIWLASLTAPIIALIAPLRPFGNAAATSAPWDANPFWANLISFNPLLRLPDFCIGILVCRIYHDLRIRNSNLLGRGYWLYIPGLLLELLVLGNANVLPLPFVQNGLLLPLHSLVILGLALGGGATSRFLSIPPLVFLGNASYAMYILHVPVSMWMSLVAKKVFHTEITGTGWMLCYLILVVGISSLVFKFLEHPANRILKTRLNSKFSGSSNKHTLNEDAWSTNSGKTDK